MWILWIRNRHILREHCVGIDRLGRVCTGDAHFNGQGASRRAPNSGSWQLLQACVLATERTLVTCEPFGTKLNTSLEASLHSLRSP